MLTAPTCEKSKTQVDDGNVFSEGGRQEADKAQQATRSRTYPWTIFFDDHPNNKSYKGFKSLVSHYSKHLQQLNEKKNF